MVPVIQAYADNLLRTANQRAEFNCIFIQPCSFRLTGLANSIHQPIQRGPVFLLQQLIHGGGRVEVEEFGGTRNIEDARVSLYAEAQFAVTAERKQREAFGHAALSYALQAGLCFSGGEWAHCDRLLSARIYAVQYVVRPFLRE
jgi:hypothetical protein